ncbi:MAG: hypothetical protein HC800_09350 [Phormidesmis sp. RL_2_1]|nr:hypothetical protein [Phormidesmis sp. RL_2_1]
MVYLLDRDLIDEALRNEVAFDFASGKFNFDVTRAVRRNRYWGQRLGWHTQIDAIVRLLHQQPFTPDETTFAQLVCRWQRKQKLEADGIIGPKTWSIMRAALPQLRPAPSAPTPTRVPSLNGPKVPPGFKSVKRKGIVKGLSRYGGGRLDAFLLSLKAQGKITISNNDIDTFQRIANVETSGQVQGINTWDSAVVSIGFMQWTLQHGKVQEWIALASADFKRYGIELDNRQYVWQRQGDRPTANRLSREPPPRTFCDGMGGQNASI